MYYLCLGISVAWLTYFVYLFALDRQIRDLKRRLEARGKTTAPCPSGSGVFERER